MRKQLLVGGLSAGAVVGSLVVDSGDMSAPTQRKDIDHVGMYNLIVEIGGESVARFESVSGLSSEIRVVEEGQPGMPGTVIHKRPGATTAGDVTLKGVWLATRALLDLWRDGADGTLESKTVDIVVYDDHNNELRRWSLVDCWPSKWKFPPLDGKGTDNLVEEVELAVDQIVLK